MSDYEQEQDIVKVLNKRINYDEIQKTLGTMEQSVGSGTASKHQCEECSKEGTHSLTGLSGATEYYCTEHYNEIMEMLEALSGE